MSVNQLILSGEVRKVFGAKQTVNGTSNYSFAIKYAEGDRENQIVVNAYGRLADELAMSGVDEGDPLLVAGRLKEVRWQNKETQEWHGRHDLIPASVTNLSKLVNDEGEDEDDDGGALDDE